MRENFQPPLRILGVHPAISYYAKGENLKIPVGEYEDTIQYAAESGATHLIIDNRYIPDRRSELMFLLSTRHVPPELEFVKAFNDQSAGTALNIYKLKHEPNE